MLVFDSSALFAYLQNEDGADMVSDLLDDADVPKYVHAVNLCEVFYGFTQRAGETVAHDALNTLHAAGIEERNDMDASFWQDAGKIVATQRGNGHGIALGNAFCVALARRLGANIVAGDRPEFGPINDLQLAHVIFFR